MVAVDYDEKINGFDDFPPEWVYCEGTVMKMNN